MHSTKLFDSVPKDYMHFYHDGNLDYEKVVRTLDLKKADISAATNIKISSIRYDNKMPRELEQRLLEWAVAVNLVAGFFNDLNKTIIWFKTPNPQLGDMSPRDMIRIGRFKKLFSFIQSAINDNKE